MSAISRKKVKSQFVKEILSKPIIFDNDFDGIISIAFLNSVLEHDFSIVGLKKRLQKEEIKDLTDRKEGSQIGILTSTPWEECSFIDFEIHGCSSIGHHYLLEYGNEIINPNKQFIWKKDYNFNSKYPLSTIFYLIYLFDEYSEYTEKQLKLLAIPDKTFSNSWPVNDTYIDPYPYFLFEESGELRTRFYKCRNNHWAHFELRENPQKTLFGKAPSIWYCKACGTENLFYLKGYRTNFLQWEQWLNFNGLVEILDDFDFYMDLFNQYPHHIFGKYPAADKKGYQLIKLILKELGWDLPRDINNMLLNKYPFNLLYLIPEYKKAPRRERIPKDILHHAQLYYPHLTISRKSEIQKININNKEKKR